MVQLWVSLFNIEQVSIATGVCGSGWHHIESAEQKRI